MEWILAHADKAHWFIFGGILLAGFNLPISLDVLLIAGALLAATVVPEHTLHLFLALFFGALFSAWIAYGLGRLFGPKLLRFRLFSKLLTPDRLKRMQKFHVRFGLWSLIIGRFIPFGVRNCVFMSSGLSKTPFLFFAMRDAIACLLWTSVCFAACFFLGQNYELLIRGVKTFNLLIFSLFSVTLIGWVWYKKRKKLAVRAE